MNILAIDPGYERIGVAVIKHEKGEKDSLVYSNCFKTSAKKKFNERLKDIGFELERLIEVYKPEALAIEKLYFTTNAKTVKLTR